MLWTMLDTTQHRGSLASGSFAENVTQPSPSLPWPTEPPATHVSDGVKPRASRGSS